MKRKLVEALLCLSIIGAITITTDSVASGAPFIGGFAGAGIFAEVNTQTPAIQQVSTSKTAAPNTAAVTAPTSTPTPDASQAEATPVPTPETAQNTVAAGILADTTKTTAVVQPEVQNQEQPAEATPAPDTQTPAEQEAADGSTQQAPAVTSVIEGYTNLGVAHVDNHLNVREEPNENGKLIGKMPKDAGCEILENLGEWSKIQSGKVTGYVKNEYLYMGEEANAAAEAAMSKMAKVNTTTLYVRAEANTESTIITLVPIDEELEVVEELDGWVKVNIDSDEGYVSADYVDVSAQLPKAVTNEELKAGDGVSEASVSVVSYAKQFVGNRYVYGGTSLTNGTDCSGFTMGVYSKFGVGLPHSSRAQANCGTRVSLNEVKPGDLIFYSNGGGINHVALYIGGGQIVHASSPKSGIKISGMYYRTPVCATRVMK